ncbi:MAG: hypothetical protein C0524_04405 [Rhodobacter sp.]|nr:hypothetical protein [Rhodobacter sp.]
MPSGHQLTEFGFVILPHPESVAASAEHFEQAAHDLSTAHIGIFRLMCREPIAFRLTQSGLLDRFQAKHPNLKVEFVLSHQNVDCSGGRHEGGCVVRVPR